MSEVAGSCLGVAGKGDASKAGTRFLSSSSFLCFWKGVSFLPTEKDNPPTMP